MEATINPRITYPIGRVKKTEKEPPTLLMESTKYFSRSFPRMKPMRKGTTGSLIFTKTYPRTPKKSMVHTSNMFPFLEEYAPMTQSSMITENIENSQSAVGLAGEYRLQKLLVPLVERPLPDAAAFALQPADAGKAPQVLADDRPNPFAATPRADKPVEVLVEKEKALAVAPIQRVLLHLQIGFEHDRPVGGKRAARLYQRVEFKAFADVTPFLDIVHVEQEGDILRDKIVERKISGLYQIVDDRRHVAP